MRIVIVYGSLTWNNQIMAERIEECIKVNYPQVSEIKLVEWFEVEPTILKEYDFSFVGSSTWGDWDPCDVMVQFIDDIPATNLSGIKTAVFCNGSRSFEQFCKVWDTLNETLSDAGAQIIWEIIKVDWEIDESFDEIDTWTKSIMKEIL